MTDLEFDKKLNEALEEKWKLVLRNRAKTDRSKFNFGSDEQKENILKLLKK